MVQYALFNSCIAILWFCSSWFFLHGHFFPHIGLVWGRWRNFLYEGNTVNHFDKIVWCGIRRHIQFVYCHTCDFVLQGKFYLIILAFEKFRRFFVWRYSKSFRQNSLVWYKTPYSILVLPYIWFCFARALAQLARFHSPGPYQSKPELNINPFI